MASRACPGHKGASRSYGPIPQARPRGTMGEFDVMTLMLMKLMGIDPLNLPEPVRLLGFTMTVMYVTVLIWIVWNILRYVFNSASELFDTVSSKQKIVIGRDFPPFEMKGMGRPLVGTEPSTTARLMVACRPSMAVMPAAM